jgi:hypothetical protein
MRRTKFATAPARALSAVLVCGLGAFAIAATATESSSAQNSPGQTGQPAATPAPAATPPPATTPAPAAEAKPLEITGFRSAMFGATEAEVRAAAMKDFGVGVDAIHNGQNLAAHTQILTVRAPDVLPEGGAADVAYSLGYKSKKLSQVAVTWSKQTDERLTPERLLQNGESLRDYFQSAGYVPESVVSNAPVKDGVLLFRGADAQGRTTVLLLQGVTSGEKASGEKATRQFSPSALVLLYLADPKNPDIYRVPAGKF